MQVTFIASEQVASSITTFYFQPEKPLHYVAGQFIELTLPHEQPDERGDKRWFTLSSSPRDEYLAITTHFAAARQSSFKRTLQQLEPGTSVAMSSPMGDFVVPKDASIPLFFIAGGIGCTPFHSIIRDLRLSGETRDISLLYAAKQLEDVAFMDTFNTLGDKFMIQLQEPDPQWTGLKGKIGAEDIMERTHVDQYIYMSGPEPMIETLYKDLRHNGVNKRHLFTDYFPGYPDQAA